MSPDRHLPQGLPRRLAWVLSALFLACGGNGATGGADAFDRFWSDFDTTYSYFDYKQVDWNAGRAELRQRAAATTSVDTLLVVLQDAVTPLRDFHVWFRPPSGPVRPSAVPTRVANWDQTTWSSYLGGLGWHQESNWGWGRSGDVGYISVGGWDPSRIHIEDLDAALDQLQDTRILVIDVRMNGGGDDSLALAFAGRFATAPVTFGATRVRNGPMHSDFTPWTDRILQPRGPWNYTNPVYLLAGAASFSSTESFVAAMLQLPQVTVAGDTTGGSSGNPREFQLSLGGRDTGWKYSVPQWMERTASGLVIEWNGLPPDEVVPTEPGRDAVLEWALAR